MDGFNLGDFLNTGIGAYTAISSAQTTADTAKANQAAAASQAAAAAQNATTNSQIRTYLIYGGAALVTLLVLAIVWKKLAK